MTENTTDYTNITTDKRCFLLSSDIIFLLSCNCIRPCLIYGPSVRAISQIATPLLHFWKDFQLPVSNQPIWSCSSPTDLFYFKCIFCSSRREEAWVFSILAGMGNQVNNCFLLCLIYIFSSKIAFKKNLEDKHTLLLQLKNPKPNKKQQYEKTAYWLLSKITKRIKCNSVWRQSRPVGPKLLLGLKAYRTEKKHLAQVWVRMIR